eukprot:12910677-Prorocentrum_lima.AAC.1
MCIRDRVEEEEQSKRPWGLHLPRRPKQYTQVSKRRLKRERAVKGKGRHQESMNTNCQQQRRTSFSRQPWRWPSGFKSTGDDGVHLSFDGGSCCVDTFNGMCG